MRLSALIRALEADVAPQEARYIIKQRTGLGWGACIARPETILPETVLAQIADDLRALKGGMPLSRLYGVRAFWGRDFRLSPETLDPRIDTETLVSRVLASFKDQNAPLKVLDLGTGSGCLLLTLLCEFPQAVGVGIDLSEGALRTARENAKALGVTERAGFVCGDWAESVQAPFDLVVSNPPYIVRSVIPSLADSVRNYDPILALDGGEDGLAAYEILFAQLPRLLKKHGRAFFEIGADQGKTVPRLSADSGVFDSALCLDSAGLPRVVEIFFTQQNGDK